MLTLVEYHRRPGDLVFPPTGRMQVRIRPLADGTVRLTNIPAGHSTTIESMERAVATANRIVRVLRAGGPA